jgi:hypothetical protein
MRMHKVLALLASAAVSSALLSAQAVNPRAWIGHEAEIEEYLKVAEITAVGTTPEGVLHPQKMTLKPGGPTPFLLFKPIAPGLYNGAQESYKSEIAAYEIDKMLHLGMVPPTVERTINKKTGAAIYWIVNTKNFNAFPEGKAGGAPTPPASKAEYWKIQLVRAKMFDSLIGNMDPNLGNWLVDDDWNLSIVDHSRSLHYDTTFVHEKQMSHIDSELWDKMKALTLEDLTANLSKWLSKSDIKTIIDRRDKFGKLIDALVKKNGAAEVFIKYPG